MNRRAALDRRQASRLILLCSSVYFASYVCRINLAATLVEVTASGMASTRMAALSLTLCSITYGAGQIVSGFLGDRFKPQSILLCGYALTSAMNLCVALVPRGELLPLLWAVNGFAQSLMWPPLVVIMSSCLSEQDYQKGVVRVSWGSSFGTIAVYLAAPVLIAVFGLRSVFLFSATVAAAAAAVWVVAFRRSYASLMPERSEKSSASASAVPMDRTGLVLIITILVAVMLQGLLRDGVTNWMPTYMAQSFQLSSSTSILSGVVLPLFSLLSFQLASTIQKRWIPNELTCAGVIFGAGCLSALVLYLTNAGSMIVSLLCLALLVGSMHGVNLMLVCYTPRQFTRYGRTGLISGVVNSGTYVGSAVSGYGMALFSESFGWHATIGLWVIVAVLGTAVCLLLRRKWRLFVRA